MIDSIPKNLCVFCKFYSYSTNKKKRMLHLSLKINYAMFIKLFAYFIFIYRRISFVSFHVFMNPVCYERNQASTPSILLLSFLIAFNKPVQVLGTVK